MGIRSKVVLILISLLLTLAPIAGAASLWSDDSKIANMTADRKATTVGDVLTIIVSEQTATSNGMKTSNDKKSSVGIEAGSGLFTFFNAANAGMGDSFTANGSQTRNNTVSARITVRVIERKPNGNLVVSGTQSINVNGEEQKITLTGTVRPENVTYDNTVLSSYLADAQIKIDGKGPLASKQRAGILTRVFNWIF